MEANEFVVESMRHCFVCINSVKLQNGFSVDSKHGRDAGLQSKCSLSSFSSYLKMDMGKVFHDNDSIPQHLLDKVRKSKLKGELCDECSLMNDKFSELYRKLVKIEMELASSLQSFQNKFLNANEAGKEVGLRNLANSVVNSNGGWTGKLDILEVLRAEAIQRCSQKLKGNDTPRVKVQNLTNNQVSNEKQKFKSNATTGTGHSLSFEALSHPKREYKVEKTDYPGQLVDDDDNYADYQDMDIPCADEDQSSSPINDKEYEDEGNSSTAVDERRLPEFGNLKTYRDDTNNVNDSVVVIIPPESRNVPKPQCSINPKTGKFKCNLCPREVSSQGSFKIHYDSVHLKVKYKCTICGAQFTQRAHYTVHHRTVHLGVRVQCLRCNKIFKYKCQLNEHQRKHGCKKTVTKTD